MLKCGLNILSAKVSACICVQMFYKIGFNFEHASTSDADLCLTFKLRACFSIQITKISGAMLVLSVISLLVLCWCYVGAMFCWCYVVTRKKPQLHQTHQCSKIHGCRKWKQLGHLQTCIYPNFSWARYLSFFSFFSTQFLCQAICTQTTPKRPK